MIELVLMLIVVAFVVPPIMLMAIAFWCWVLFGLDARCRQVEAGGKLPYCDIDPRNHPAFIWAVDGNGYIDNVLVRRRP